MNTSPWKSKVFVCLAIVSLLSACKRNEAPAPQTAPPANPPAASTSSAASPSASPHLGGLPDFTQLVKKEGPAVVNISTTSPPSSSGSQLPELQGLSPNDPLYQFFKQFIGPQLNQQQTTPVQTLGSGFIISKDGYILTNDHVVENATDIRVRLTDKREFKAKLIGADKLTDVALLKINAGSLPVVNIGNSDKLPVGAWVAAIGQPFGFQNSITQGIVSAESRYLPSENYVPFIQTDAPINPGNSGGPLFNLNDQVVGITSQIYSQTGGYMGIGFAIPINTVMQVEKQLQTQGHVTRGMIGASIQEMTPDLARSFGLSSTTGALVAGVTPDGPAAQAGVQPGDVILSYNNQPITDANILPGMVAQTRPGTQVPVQIWRKGQKLNLTITVGELHSAATTAPSAAPSRPQIGRLGLALRPLSPAQQQRLGTNHGLLIERVQGAAAQAGIQQGDVLLAINNVNVQTVDQVRRLLSGYRTGQTIALLIMRDGNSIYVPLTLGS